VTLPAGAVSELVEGVKIAYTSAIGQAFTIGALLLAGSAILTWFGMRGKSSRALEETGVDA
jgi:hypothetical protein